MIHVLDRQQDKIIATFDKGQVYRAQFRADNQLLMVLELEVPLLDSRVKYLAKRERLIIEDESGALQELIIFETDTDTVAGIKYVYCHAAYVDIGKAKVIDPVTLTGQTATTAATFVVNGTRYKVGRVEGAGFRAYTVEDPSNPYQQLLAIATLFGLKLRFRIEVAGNLVIGRYVDLLERLGRDNGKEVVFGKDLMGLRRREDSSRIVTALKCYGPEQSDGTRLTVIVTDDDARQRWSTDGNHLWGIYEPQSEDADMTLARLTQLGEGELKKRIDSVVEYDVEHYDMSHIPEFAHEAAYLHDTIRVKDEQYEPALYLQAEIIEVEYDLFDRSTKKSKLGQFIEYDAEDILKQIQAYIAKNAARIIRSDEPPDGRDNLIWVDTSQDPEVAHTWNGTDWVAARGIKGDTGPQGPKGDKGDKGEAGPAGLQGVQGPKGDQGVEGPVGADGLSSFTHIAYANNATGTSGFSVSDSTNKLYIGIYVDNSPTDSMDPSHYNWTLIKGQDGTQGLPGPKGADGQTPYFHTAWANSADGTSGFSTTDSVNKLYLGTYTDFESADSNNPASYSWTKIKGDTGSQGIQGPQGPAGQTFYTWLKYADTPTTGMSDSPTGKAYIGLAYNKTTATESSNYSDYTWSLVKGEKGDQGVQGPNGANGQPTFTWIKYGTSATGAGMSDDPTGKTYIGIAYNKTVQTESTNPADYIWSLIQGPKGDVGATGPQGPQGVPGVQGPAGPNGQSLFTWVKYATSAAGANMSDLPDGKAYIGFAYNKTTSTESTNPADYTWAKIEGPQGVQGATGPNGQTLYTWLKYADSPTSGMSDSPTGKLYMGLAYNKTTSVESTNYADYSWSLIKGETGATGPQGPQGIQGPTGPSGVSQYVHIRYSANADGSAMTTAPQANTAYIGLANTTSATAPTANTAYSWSLFKGPQGNTGIQGPPGTNGVTTYTWVKYADTITGSGMSDTPSGKRFVGFAFNKTTATESNVASDYAWSPLYDNVVVGGRNIICNSKVPTNGNYWNGAAYTVVTEDGKECLRFTGAGTSYTSYRGAGASNNIPLEANTEYVYSVFVKTDTSFAVTTTFPLHWHVAWNGNNSGGFVPGTFALDSESTVFSGAWRRIVLRFKTINEQGIVFRPYFYGQIPSGAIFYLSEFKLEKGNIATDWTPAPEDVDAAITNAQTTADGKNAVFYQTSAPPTAGRKVNDLWFDTDDGNRIYIFNGTTWAPAPFGTNALAQLSITNALIANGTIQDAKIANVTAAKIIANSLSAISANLGTIEAGHIGGVTLDLAGGKLVVDAFGNVKVAGVIQGSEILLGGLNNQDGVLHLYDENGEVIFSLDAGDIGSSKMTVAEINSPSVLGVQQTSRTIYVNGVAGDDMNTGATVSTAFKTIQRALDVIPKFLRANVTLEVETATYNESVVVIGFQGEGNLRINLKKCGINGHLRIQNCTNIIDVRGQDFNNHAKIGTTDSTNPVSVVTSSYVILDSIWAKANNRANNAVYVAASNVFTNHCVHERALESAMFTAIGANLYAYGARGSGNAAAAKATGCSKIHMEFRKPAFSGSSAISQTGGTITESAGITIVPSPGDASGSTPTEPTTPSQGKIMPTSTSCRSHSTVFGWKSGESLYQGSWETTGNYRGLMFFDAATIQSQLAGKTIKSVRLYVKRQDRGGSSAASQLQMHLHNLTSVPAGTPTLGTSIGSPGALSWGEEKWVTLPNSVGEALKNGTAKGLALFASSGKPYLVMNPVVQLEINFEG